MSDSSIEKIVDRILKGLGAKNQSQLAITLGITPARISSAKNKGEIPFEWLVKLASEKNLNPNWLLTGQGPMQIGIDDVFLEEVIRSVEEYLDERRDSDGNKVRGWLPPAKKAKLIVVLYNLYAGEVEKINNEMLEDLIILAGETKG